MHLSLVFPLPQDPDDQVKVLAAALDADGKVVSDWLAVAAVAPPRGRVHWNFKQGDRLWIWVVQSRFGKPGEMTNARVVLELTPKKEEPPAAPWPSPGPTTMSFQWAVPIRCGTLPQAQCGVDRMDFTNYPAHGVSVAWNYPSFRITGRQEQELGSIVTTFDVVGRVDLANKTMEGVFKFEYKQGYDTYQLRVNLSALTCFQFDETFRYGYRCSVRNADLLAAPARYVWSFLYEQYEFDVLVGFGTPQYSMLTAPDVKAIVIEFAAAK